MFDKLEDLLIRFEEIMGELHEPTVTNNQERFRKLMKEQSDLTPIVDAYTEYKKCKQDIEDSLSMLEEEKDEEMREMIKETLNDSKKRVEELEQELKILLLPKDPNDDKNVIVEIRAGAGGDEAALFAAEIYRMYVHYAEKQRWKVELINVDEIGIGGMKSVTFMINGQGAYSMMKYESGVHRVQRVPETESGGRIHTSTITVAVIIVTGVLGNIFGELICKIFRIKEPIAKGLALGSAAHAIGTAKAMEMGEVEGAISSLSIAVTGLLTVIAASIAANLY